MKPDAENSNRCCTPDSLAQARRVAAILDIPFYAVDVKELFRSTVVQAFLDGYAQGLTPNPCLVCNRQIKWGFLLEHALALGADYLASGHYARKRMAADGREELLRAVDHAKDQSYVLHVLTQERLGQALFPVGEYSKPEIRELARSFNLPTADPPGEPGSVLPGRAGLPGFHPPQCPTDCPTRPHPGPRRADSRRTPGAGLLHHRSTQGPGNSVKRPVVCAGEGCRHQYAGGRCARMNLGQRELTVQDVNWIAGAAPAEPLRLQVKTRYTAREAWAMVTPLERGRVDVHFEEPQRDLTPGQAAVFYDGEIVLGGGLIL